VPGGSFRAKTRQGGTGGVQQPGRTIAHKLMGKEYTSSVKPIYQSHPTESQQFWPLQRANNSSKAMEGVSSSGTPPQAANSSSKAMEGAGNSGIPPQTASNSTKPMERRDLKMSSL
jgi:hypothetical protein